ncbi:nuclear transport factor 2 family protein [Thermodesulfobacteriota bacterium]
MEELIRSYFRLINEEKFDEFFALFDPKVDFSAPFGFQVKGVEKLKPFYLRVPDNFPEHEDSPAKIIISGNNVAVFIDFTGKKKDGTSVSFNAMDWFVIENGKIKSLNIFFDSFTTSKL